MRETQKKFVSGRGEEVSSAMGYCPIHDKEEYSSIILLRRNNLRDSLYS